jgi:hypothetical protein
MLCILPMQKLLRENIPLFRFRGLVALVLLSLANSAGKASQKKPYYFN